MEFLGLVDSGVCYPACIENVNMLLDAFNPNEVPRCQDLQDLVLCSLAQAIDTGKALAVDDVIEIREVYESEHPVVSSSKLYFVEEKLQVPRLSSVDRYEIETDPWSSPISSVVLQNDTLAFTVNYVCLADTSGNGGS